MELVVEEEAYSLKDLPLIGEHNFKNYICAILAANLDGITIQESINSLKSFKGVKRRMDYVGEISSIKIYDDFSHHPTAIKLSTSAIKNKYPDKRIIGLIELASNTMSSGHHEENLIDSFSSLDEVLLLDHKKVYDYKNAYDSIESLIIKLQEIVFDYDIILIMTNKDSQKFINPIINHLESK